MATDLTPDMNAALAVDGSYPELFEAAFGTDEITPVRIACTYDDLGGVEAIIARRSNWIHSVTRNFDSGPSFEVRLPSGQAPALREELLEQLGGRPGVELLPELLIET